MKSIVLSLAFALVSLVGFGQLDYTGDTAIIGMKNGFSSTSHILMTNNTGNPVQISWTNLSTSLNNNWEIQFCDCNTCYSNEFAPIPGSATCNSMTNDGSYIDWKFIIDPKTESVTEEYFVLDIHNETDGTHDTIVFKTQFDATVGINNISKESSFSLYPNPADNYVLVDYALETNDATLLITNVLGEIVMEEYIDNSQGDVRLDTEKLDRGYYFVQLQSNGKSLTQKLVLR